MGYSVTDHYGGMNEIAGRQALRFVTLEELERDHIVRALEHTHWRVSGDKGAAAMLGIKPTTLEARMKKLGIERAAKQ